MKLKILKTWVSKDYTIIFQASPLAPKELGLPKKVHLLLDLRQQSFGLRFTSEKPQSATANHAFIQILRKHMEQFTIKEIFREESGDIYIPLLQGPEDRGFWTIKLTASKPPLASLIDPSGVIHVSFGQKGTFTKKHEGQAIPALSDFNGMMDDLQKELIPAEVESQNHEDEHEGDELGEAAKEPISEEQRELASRLKRKLKTTKKNLEKMRSELPKAHIAEEARRQAQHLQQYAYLIKADAFELRLDALQTSHGEAMAIPLDPERTAGQNIENAFQLARKLERKLKLGQEQILIFEHHESDLTADIELLRLKPASTHYLQSLVDKYKLPSLQTSTTGHSAPQVAKPFKTYISSSGHPILVGKGAKENDVLTKSARANDYWFHAAGVTGSHVIVPFSPDLREGLPTLLLKEAAILALHSSRFKEDQAGECYVTRRSSLKKQKNMPAGLWKIEHSETIFIRYSSEELQKILAKIRA